MSNAQNLEKRRRFGGSIIAWLTARASSVLRILSSTLGRSTSGIERRILNEKVDASSVPASSTNTAIENNTLLAPHLSAERNEVSGGSPGELTSPETATGLNSRPTPPPSLPVQGGGFAADATFPTNATVTNSSRVSAHENSVINSQSSSAKNAASPPFTDLTKGDPRFALERGFITRQELKRELDSLRRLIESRK